MRQTCPEMIRFRAPKDFSSLIAAAAYENYQSVSDFMGQLVVAEIGKRGSEEALLRDAKRVASRGKLGVSQSASA